MTTLPDTSVWIDYLRHGLEGPAARVDSLLADGEVLVCGPVAAELTSGIADDGQRAELWSLLGGLPWVRLDRNGWLRVAEIMRALDRGGSTVALTDIEIAVAGSHADAVVWSFDSDFQRVADVMPELTLVSE